MPLTFGDPVDGREEGASRDRRVAHPRHEPSPGAERVEKESDVGIRDVGGIGHPEALTLEVEEAARLLHVRVLREDVDAKPFQARPSLHGRGVRDHEVRRGLGDEPCALQRGGERGGGGLHELEARVSLAPPELRAERRERSVELAEVIAVRDGVVEEAQRIGGVEEEREGRDLHHLVALSRHLSEVGLDP